MSGPRLSCPHCGALDWTRAPELADTLAFIAGPGPTDTTARDVAQHFNLSIASASNRMHALRAMEMIVGRRRPAPGGGSQYVHRITARGRREVAAMVGRR